MKHALKQLKNSYGFTLIEMIFCISVILVILLLVVPNVTSKNNLVKNKSCDAQVEVVNSQIVLYEIDTGHLPTSMSQLTSGSHPYLTEKQATCPNHKSIHISDGHAYHDPKLGSDNTNFALLVSHQFSEPFNQPNEFAHAIARLANRLSNGSIIVQKYGDIKKGRRSTAKRIKEGYTVPTLPEAVPGDLGLVLPYNTMKSIIEMIEALDHVTPGIANEHTLLYRVEAKFYSARVKVHEGFETDIDSLYVAGDGAGLTRGLSQAGANGILVARDIVKKLS